MTTDTDTAHAHHGYISDKKGYLDRLKRIEGQARGISRMVDEEKYCIDILTQISAVTSALETVASGSSRRPPSALRRRRYARRWLRGGRPDHRSLTSHRPARPLLAPPARRGST